MKQRLATITCSTMATMTVIWGLIGCAATSNRSVSSAEHRAERRLEASRKHQELLASIREKGEQVRGELQVIRVQWAKKAIEIAETSDDGVTDVDVVALSAVRSAGYSGEYTSIYLQFADVDYNDAVEAAARFEDQLAAALVIRLLNRRREEGANRKPATTNRSGRFILQPWLMGYSPC